MIISCHFCITLPGSLHLATGGSNVINNDDIKIKIIVANVKVWLGRWISLPMQIIFTMIPKVYTFTTKDRNKKLYNNFTDFIVDMYR